MGVRVRGVEVYRWARLTQERHNLPSWVPSAQEGGGQRRAGQPTQAMQLGCAAPAIRPEIGT